MPQLDPLDAVCASLPAGADVARVREQLLTLAQQVSFTEPRNYKRLRKRYTETLRACRQFMHGLRQLNPPRQSPDSDWYTRLRPPAGEAIRWLENCIEGFDALVSARNRGVDPFQEAVHAAILRIWLQAGGKLRISRKPPGPLVRYFTQSHQFVFDTAEEPKLEAVIYWLRRQRPLG
jgi:hypothetical protein